MEEVVFMTERYALFSRMAASLDSGMARPIRLRDTIDRGHIAA
jgi:hypothetical protein